MRFTYPGGGPPKPSGGPGGNPGPGILWRNPGDWKPGGGPCMLGGPKPNPPGGANVKLRETPPIRFSMQRTRRHHPHATTSRHASARSDR